MTTGSLDHGVSLHSEVNAFCTGAILPPIDIDEIPEVPYEDSPCVLEETKKKIKFYNGYLLMVKDCEERGWWIRLDEANC